MTNTIENNQPSSSAIEIIRQLQSNGVIGGEAARYLKELIEIQTKAAYSKGASDMLEKVAVMREELGQCYQFNPKYSTETKDRMAIENLERVNEVLNAMDELLSQYNNKQGESEKEQ